MPTKFFYKEKHDKTLDNSLIGGGCIITDAEISSSVLFDRIKVQAGTMLDHAVILPNVQIGKNCRLRNCIIERSCVIPDGMEIGVDIEADRARGFRISSSGKVTLVTRPMLEHWLARQPQADA